MINWKTKINPSQSGMFLVSIKETSVRGEIRAYSAIALYNVDANMWYKYDPYTHKNEDLSESFEIKAWADEILTYLVP